MDAHEVKALTYVVEQLVIRFPHTSRELITKEVMTRHERFQGAKVRGYLGILIERETTDMLRAAGHAELHEFPHSA